MNKDIVAEATLPSNPSAGILSEAVDASLVQKVDLYLDSNCFITGALQQARRGGFAAVQQGATNFQSGSQVDGLPLRLQCRLGAHWTRAEITPCPLFRSRCLVANIDFLLGHTTADIFVSIANGDILQAVRAQKAERGTRDWRRIRIWDGKKPVHVVTVLEAAGPANAQLVPGALTSIDITPDKMDVFIDSNCFMFGARAQWLASGAEGVANHSAQFEEAMQDAATQLEKVVRLLVPHEVVIEIEEGTGSDPQAQADDPSQ